MRSPFADHAAIAAWTLEKAGKEKNTTIRSSGRTARAVGLATELLGLVPHLHRYEGRVFAGIQGLSITRKA